ncbi:MAG: hypothetical protein QXD13_01340 [Candidatus Pacearchaeota archaeon]
MAKMKNDTLQKMIARGLTGPFRMDSFKLGYGSFIKGDVNLGENVKIGHGTTIIAENGRITLEDKVRVGNNITIECEEGEDYIGYNVHIKSGSRLGSNISIGEECELGFNTIIEKNARIGKRNKFSNCTIASPAQDLRDKGYGEVIIGDDNKITEYVVINRGTFNGGGKTIIGNRNNIFSQIHIAHDCIIGNNTEIITMAGLAGHVVVEDYVRISGQVGVAPWVHIGEGAFVGGQSGVIGNVLPYSRVDGSPAFLSGINFERLKRLYGLEWKKAYREIKNVYEFVKNKKYSDDDLKYILRHSVSKPAKKIAKFMENLNPRCKEILRFGRSGG